MPAFRTMNPFEFSLYFYETELLCEACTPPPDPKKKLIEYLQKHMGVTFTEEEMDAFSEKGDSELFFEEVYRKQKASHCRSSLENHNL